MSAVDIAGIKVTLDTECACSLTVAVITKGAGSQLWMTCINPKCCRNRGHVQQNLAEALLDYVRTFGRPQPWAIKIKTPTALNRVPGADGDQSMALVINE